MTVLQRTVLTTSQKVQCAAAARRDNTPATRRRL